MLADVIYCLKEEYVPANQDDRPGELNSNGDTVRSRVLTVLGRIVYNGSQKQSNGDSQLVRSDNRSTDPFWRSFTLVHGNCKAVSPGLKNPREQRRLTECRNKTNSVSSEETASNEKRLCGRGSLHDNTQIEDQTS